MVDFSLKIHLIGNLETGVMLGLHQNHTKSRLKMIGDTQYMDIDTWEVAGLVETTARNI